MHPRPKLTENETDFLRAWIWEEANFQRPHTSTAKRIQVEKSPYAAPLLADIVTAALPPEEQVAIATGPEPRSDAAWPWPTDDDLRRRHQEARGWLESRFVGSRCRLAENQG